MVGGKVESEEEGTDCAEDEGGCADSDEQSVATDHALDATARRPGWAPVVPQRRGP
jgi:hypothetical protein